MTARPKSKARSKAPSKRTKTSRRAPAERDRPQPRAQAGDDGELAALIAKPWTQRVEAIETMIDELRTRPSGAELRVLVERLLSLTGDEKWEVRRAIARGLVHVEHPLFEKIAERLEGDDNQYVSQAAQTAADRRRELDREYQRKTDEIDVVANELSALRQEHGEAAASAAERLADHKYKLLTNETTHEMRTVVAGLLDALDKLYANLEGSRTAKKLYDRNLGIARDRARFLKRMLEDTKRFVDDPQYESEDVELAELLDKVVGLVSDALDIPGVRLDTQLETRPGTRVHVPRGRLLQALSSLVKNAVEACEGDGTVTIRCGHHRRGQVRIEIVDDGYGMAPEEIDRALLPLVSTKKDDQHTGVGLPLARKIIKRECRGGFDIHSEPDQGTTVICLLPESG